MVWGLGFRVWGLARWYILRVTWTLLVKPGRGLRLRRCGTGLEG